MDLPNIGLGTYKNTGKRCVETVRTALEMGYRHVDTAKDYGNQEAVGRGIAESDVPREEIFVATKIVHDTVPGETYEDVIEEADLCLDLLGVETVDLLYVHWPVGVYDPETVLPAFEQLRDDGKIRHIGLSNFTQSLLDEAREILEAPLFAHQVEMHPLLQQERLREYADEHDHQLVAFSPLAKGRVFDVPELTEIAEKHGVSEARVSLAWITSKGVVPVPKATGKDHLRDNFEAQRLDLPSEDIARIDAIDREERIVDPEWGTDWGA